MRVICDNVSKIYDTAERPIPALAGITFQTEESEFLCIVGPSGCGKTTLLKIIAGLIPSSTGSVRYEGERRQAPLNAMVFQEDSVFPWLPVLDNVAFPLEARGVPRRERYRAAAELLERVGLSRFAGNYPHELSTGMKQRVGIARALACNPEVLLMDEPFAALDAQLKAILQEELLSLWSGHRRTVLYVTHDIEEAVFLGDRVFVMSHHPGRIIAEIPVPFPRPRAYALRGSAAFGARKEEIWLLLRDQVREILAGR